jgi:hypothetical protein
MRLSSVRSLPTLTILLPAQVVVLTFETADFNCAVHVGLHVCCVPKGEAQFFYIFNAVNITLHGYLVEEFSSRVY